MRPLSVVIPAYNRPRSLARCIERFERQTLPPDRFEVIVVDDGSDDPLEPSTRLTAPLKVVRQQNKGPAAARNRGVQEAEGETVVFIGDDIVVPPDFLQVHLDFHRKRPAPMAGALGRVDWPAEYLEDPYMRWLDGSGLQFGYRGLEPGQKLEHYHFYTANLSIKRETLLAYPFDEQFRHAAWEDTDLGLSLTAAGFELYYLAEATAEHHHFYTLEESCRHRRTVGQAARLFEQKHPDRFPRRWIRRHAAPLRWVLDRFGERWPAFYYSHRNAEAFWAGYREGG